MSIEAYLDARDAFAQAKARVDEYARELSIISDALRNKPNKIIVSNVSLGLPMEASMSRDSLSIDGSGWKTAEQFQQMLSDFHDAKSKMQNAWSTIPESRRAGLQQPITFGRGY
ncbi:hypothetical protein [Shinella sp.]|jgi:hypothetical protein|uniref:hypothetical protein n=1 Tax=Shinella sp. TaxID=1870904 RepID=UPI003F6ED8FD